MSTAVDDKSNCSNAETVDMKALYIDADEFHVRSYVDVLIEDLPVQKALIDGGSEVCCIKADLVRHLNLPAGKQVHLSGLSGKSNIVDVVRLNVKPALESDNSVVNIAPPVRAWFAVVPELNESVILTPNVVSLLRETARYNVLSPCLPNASIDDCDDEVNIDSDNCCATSVNDAEKNQNVTEVGTSVNVAPHADAESTDFIDIENPQSVDNDRVADSVTLAAEQKACPSLRECWELASQNKGNFLSTTDCFITVKLF